MTGTSLDGLDVALVEVVGSGLAMRATLRGTRSTDLGDLRGELRHFASGGAAEPLRYLRAARRLGELHAECVARLCEDAGLEKPSESLAFVVAHGQTIWHAPLDDVAMRGASEAGLSWQLFDPWPLVRRLGVPVCYDLRQADLIAGGQGAPITPMSDLVMYREERWPRLIVNLGGVCNVTWLEEMSGSDVGPCNILIDGVVSELFPGLRYDEGGVIARRGKADVWVYDELMKAPFFRNRIVMGGRRFVTRSTGREDFSGEWVKEIARGARERMTAEDAVASAVDAVARVIGDEAQKANVAEVVLAGGGARNEALVEAIRSRSPARVILSDELGVPVEAREAMAFAVLGALSRDGVAITLPAVTGADAPGRAGVWAYP